MRYIILTLATIALGLAGCALDTNPEADPVGEAAMAITVYADPSIVVAAIQGGATYSAGKVDDGGGAKFLKLNPPADPEADPHPFWSLDASEGVLLYNQMQFTEMRDGYVVDALDPDVGENGEYLWTLMCPHAGQVQLGLDEAGKAHLIDP